MEKVIGELYKSGDKIFTTEEECLHYEKTKAIEDFLVTQGYEWVNGRMQKEKHKEMWHSFTLFAKRVRYSLIQQYQVGSNEHLDFHLCDIDTFKTFYDNMFIE